MNFTTGPTTTASETTHERFRPYLDSLDTFIDFTHKQSLQCLCTGAHLVRFQQRFLATDES